MINLYNMKKPTVTKTTVSKTTVSNTVVQEHKFWSTQPMSSPTEKIGTSAQIKEIVPLNEEHPLPEGFVWRTFDINNRIDREMVADFLDKHFTENSKDNFHPRITQDYVRWRLRIPGSNHNIALGVIKTDGELLVGFISGRDVIINLNNKELTVAETNFLCTHHKLRTKHLASTMIKELARRYQLLGIQQGCFESTKNISQPFANVNIYTRAINIKLLLENKYLEIEEDIVDIDDVKRILRLPDVPRNKNFRLASDDDIEKVFAKYNDYNSKFNFYQVMTLDEFKHVFFNNKFVSTYVVDNNDHTDIEDFVSFTKRPYHVPPSKQGKQEYIHVGKMFYYTSTIETSYRLMHDSLVMAKNEGIDVFKSYDIAENQHILRELNFDKNAQASYYYFYNYKTPVLNTNQINKYF